MPKEAKPIEADPIDVPEGAAAAYRQPRQPGPERGGSDRHGGTRHGAENVEQAPSAQPGTKA
jgi:hypothetical protein